MKKLRLGVSGALFALAFASLFLVGCGGGGGGSGDNTNKDGNRYDRGIDFDSQYGVNLALALTADEKRLNIDSSSVKETVALIYGPSVYETSSALSASSAPDKFIPTINGGGKQLAFARHFGLKRAASQTSPISPLAAQAKDGDIVNCDISGYAKFFGDNVSAGGFTYHDCSDDAGYYLNGFDKLQGNKAYFDNLLHEEDPYEHYDVRSSGFDEDDAFSSALPLTLDQRGTYGETDPDEEQIFGYNKATFSQIFIEKSSGNEIAFGLVSFHIYEDYDRQIFIYRGLRGYENFAYFTSENVGQYDCDAYDDGIETRVGEHNISKSENSPQKIRLAFGSGNVKVDYIDDGSTIEKFNGTCSQFADWLQN